MLKQALTNEVFKIQDYFIISSEKLNDRRVEETDTEVDETDRERDRERQRDRDRETERQRQR